jgi:HSP20 family molecular chaperone IbpA
VDAQYRNGVLHITLEKQPQAQAKRIPVKTA